MKNAKKAIFYSIFCFIFITISCKNTQQTANARQFVLTKWDTLLFTPHFTGEMLAGGIEYAFYTQKGSFSLGENTFDITETEEDNFADLMLPDTIFSVNSENLKPFLDSINSEKAPRAIVFPLQAFDAFAKFAETHKYNEIWNVLPVREWLCRKNDTLSSSELVNVNLDKDLEKERVLLLKTKNNHKMMLTLDKSGNNWLLRNALETNIYDEEDTNPPFKSFFDDKNHLLVSQTRNESGRDIAVSEDGEDDYFSINEEIRYYHNGIWSDVLYLHSKKEGNTVFQVGKFTFVTEENMHYFWQNDTIFTTVSEERTTGGWLKTPFVKHDTAQYVWHEKSNSFVFREKTIKKASQKTNQKGNKTVVKGNGNAVIADNFWGKIPTETFTDSTIYWTDSDKKLSLKTYRTYKIIEEDKRLSTKTISDFTVFDTKKWVTTAYQGKASLKNSRGETVPVSIENADLAAALQKITGLVFEQNSLKKEKTDGKFPKAWLQRLEKGVIPAALAAFEPLYREISNESINWQTAVAKAKPKVFTLSSGDKAIYLKCENVPYNFLIAINPTTEMHLGTTLVYADNFPILQDDFLVFDYKNEDDNRAIEYQRWEAGESEAGEWKAVLTETEQEEIGVDLRESVKIISTSIKKSEKSKVKSGVKKGEKATISVVYSYTWATNDGKTTLLNATPLQIDWVYDETDKQYTAKTYYYNGKALPKPENGDIKNVVFRYTINKLLDLQKTGTSEQKKWLTRYLPFYCDKYNLDNCKNIAKINHIEAHRLMKFRSLR